VDRVFVRCRDIVRSGLAFPKEVFEMPKDDEIKRVEAALDKMLDELAGRRWKDDDGREFISIPDEDGKRVITFERLANVGYRLVS
jgi:hypothetical protein